MRNHRSAVAVFTVAVGLAAAKPAVAAPEWNDGLPEDHFTQTCESIGGVGGYREEHSSQVKAGTFVDPQNIPNVGDVFYARVAMAAVGGCGDKSFIPEVVPPLGVEVAISAAAPVRCHYTLPDGSDTASTAVRRRCSPGRMAAFRLRRTAIPTTRGPAWARFREPGTDAASGRDRVHRVSAARLAPAEWASGWPDLLRAHAAHGPVPRDAAGDFLQVPVTMYRRFHAGPDCGDRPRRRGRRQRTSGADSAHRSRRGRRLGAASHRGELDAHTQSRERHPAPDHGSGGRRANLGDADREALRAHRRGEAQRRQGRQPSPAHEAHAPRRTQAAARPHRHKATVTLTVKLPGQAKTVEKPDIRLRR